MNRFTSSVPITDTTAEHGRRSRYDLFVTLGALLAVALTLFLLVVSFVFTWPDLPLHNNFFDFWTGGWLVRNGAGPAFFDMQHQRAVQVALRQAAATTEAIRSGTSYVLFHNPPPLALLFVPLTLLPVQAAYLIWSAFSLGGFVVAVAIQLRGASHGRWKAMMLLTFGSVTLTLIEGQVNAIFLLALSLAMVAFDRDKPATGGALLGITWLGFQYAAPFALLLLVKRRWRELSGMAGAAVLTGALTLAMIGPTGILRYLEEMQRIGSFRPPADDPVSPWEMINWRGMLANLWPNVPDGIGAALVLVLGGATILIALLAWRGEWEPSSPRFARQMLVLTVATLLASPHSHLYGAVLLLAPLAAMLARSPAGILPVAGWRTLLLGGLFLSVILVPLVAQRWLLGPYLLLALGVLLFGRPVSARPAPRTSADVPSTTSR